MFPLSETAFSPPPGVFGNHFCQPSTRIQSAFCYNFGFCYRLCTAPLQLAKLYLPVQSIPIIFTLVLIAAF
jgi:hypothetical protein